MEKSPYQLSVPDALDAFTTSVNGLSGEEIGKRLLQFGPNTIPQPKSKTLAQIFFSQFLNPLIYVLIVAGVISILTGDITDAIFIAAIIVINAILGTYQEWRAEDSAKALRSMVIETCRVRRNGKIFTIKSEELVPGDVVLLASGDKAPADMRLIESHELAMEEALLTGESVAVIKNTDTIHQTGLSIGDRLNMVFAATIVQKGRGLGLVTATAASTEIGRIADSLRITAAEKPPLEKRMELFSKKISALVVVICVLLGVLGYARGMTAHDIFFLMVAVGVSAIPEGLPVALTVALAIGTNRMAKRQVIVRKLPAVEGLGSCTLIASDKTGTLTMDQQSIQNIYLPNHKVYQVTGVGYNGDGAIMDGEQKVEQVDDVLHEFMMACIMANEGILRKTEMGWEHSGDVVDVAFRALTYKLGHSPHYFFDQAQLVKMVPYESERKYSAVFFRQQGRLRYAMKGSVETVLQHLPATGKQTMYDVAETMAAEGFRVLAVAGAEVHSDNENELPPLQLLGLVGMIDPLRAEARPAVEACHAAGIEVVMVTGDHPATALAIATNLGIAKRKEEIISGVELEQFEQLPMQEFAKQIAGKKVFARVAPLQKQKIVEALKTLGHFVAVTGDGANDAPALKSAHIGVAMGAGTELAKESASIIVTDNNFASIAAGVEEGRFTYENLRKIIYLLISTGVAELLTVAIAIVLGMPMPFLALQLLWLNLVTNGIQDIALAFEKGDPTVMRQPPRHPNESIFNRQMNSQMVVSGLTISLVVMGVWYYLIHQPNYQVEHARTLIMMLMVLLQNFHVLNCRSETRSLFRMPLKNNYTLLAGIVMAQLVHISASYIPGLNQTLQLDRIRLEEWFLLLPAAASILVVMEVYKWVMKKTG